MTQALAIDSELFEEKASQAAALMRALSNPKRLMILCRLGAKELSVSDLHQEFDLSQSALSQHLAVLRHHNLVRTRRERQMVFYSIADPAAMKVIETLVAIYCPDLLP